MRKKIRNASLAVFTLGVFALPAGATILNLAANNTGSIGQCLGVGPDTCGQFFNTLQQSTGTGVIDPFYTTQADPTERGFNSDAPGANPNYDMKRGAGGSGFTKAIQVSDFGLVDINGNVCNLCATPYIRFLLDAHEANGQNGDLLSIDKLQLYVKSVNDLTSTTLGDGASTDFLTHNGTPTKIYDLDNGANANTIYMDSRLTSGSGQGDLLFYVPYSAFLGHENDWLYLYGEYGFTGTVANGAAGCRDTGGAGVANLIAVGSGDCNYDSSATFEEWARIDNPGGSAVPEPKQLIIMGAGALLLFLTDYRRRRKNKLA